LGIISLCQGAHEEAIAVFRDAVQLHKDTGNSWDEFFATYLLGRAYQASGNRAAALEQFQTCLALRGAQAFTETGTLGMDLCTLNGIEDVSDDAQWFRTYCRRFLEAHPKINETPFVQWYLEPVDVDTLRYPSPQEGSALFQDGDHDSLPPGWAWHDTFDDCSFTIGNGVVIHATNGRGLWGNNLSAPRLLRSINGDFSFQTLCTPATDGKPVMGGLLIWVDKKNYLRLDLGALGVNQITFGGALQNQALIVGRGCLPQDHQQDSAISSPAQVYLRMERIGERINAFCSADGRRWFTVGSIAFPGDNPVQVGLYAFGEIQRHIYHGAYPEGTAIRFQPTWLWGDFDPDL
jgi:regulation of enolase protein 1 (concanavalin A-like superfamily)